jgi:hypothetical protein
LSGDGDARAVGAVREYQIVVVGIPGDYLSVVGSRAGNKANDSHLLAGLRGIIN